jgi:two-component system, response regulator PdtaR
MTSADDLTLSSYMRRVSATAPTVPGCPGWDSNPHWTVFETAISADWITGAEQTRREADKKGSGTGSRPISALPYSLVPVSIPRSAHVRRVVIAEDEALIRLDLAEMLAEEGYDVVGQAGDGRTAVELAEHHRPDLVVLDVKMPRLDGISAAQRIAQQRLSPVVILTAFSERDLVERARDAGAMAYVVKPFTKHDLVPAIEMAVSRFAELRMLEVEVADLTERLETRKAVDRAKAVLQKQLDLSEPDAFRWIQKTAMDLRLSMREVAEGVLTHGPSIAGGPEPAGEAGSP